MHDDTETPPPATSNRRDFLVGTGLGVLGGLGACATAAREPVLRPAPSGVGSEPPPPPSIARAPAAPAPAGWDAVRALFPLSREHVHLAGLLLATHPRPVREAIEQHRQGLDDNPVDYHHANSERLEDAVRAAAASYLGGAADDIALTDSTTMGLGLLYGGLRLRAGDELLTTEHDHYSTYEALRFAAARTGAVVRKVALHERSADAAPEAMAAAVARALRPRTRIVAVTWVHSSTGVKIPVRAIADAVARENARRPEASRILLCVDAAHGLGSSEEKVEELGCDFLIAGCHKWMLGPRGTGIVWGRPTAWTAVSPSIPPFEWPVFRTFMEGRSPDDAPGARRFTPGGFHSFEHRWALSAAFALHEQLGRERIAGRIHELNTHAKEGLRAMPHVTLHTPVSPQSSAGIVCFEVQGLQPPAVIERLAARRIIASTTPYRVSYARLTPGLWNTPEDVDRALAVIREMG